ncbi:MAG: hypothetical protein GEV28_16310 [Actinophytocola sp.]|uniref:hypothetical protein n=1 Tax=Actinophytocola sp. TaxID=1872138 RepID=UPI00132A64A0|nr:hypothetical protein [Actinophytocola sp.]MPZ81865.1 hypothetical protein [Actinophytocola sp.]
MRPLRTGALVVAGVVTGRAVARKVAAHRTAVTTAGARWLVVTVNAPPERLADAATDLGAEVETRLTPAPGGRGTEVAARPRQTGTGATPPASDLRRALRDLKTMVEAGEVLRPDEPTTSKPTPGGALVRAITRRAGGEGRL